MPKPGAADPNACYTRLRAIFWNQCVTGPLELELQGTGRVQVEQDALPFHFGLLKIDQLGDPEAGRFQIIDAWSKMLVSEAVHALQFHDDFLFYYEIGHVFADIVPFVPDRK